MIESIIKNKENLTYDYPLLKIFNHKETRNIIVVLFRKKGEGTYLYNKNNPSFVGEYGYDFAESFFEAFDEELILKNK